MRRIVTLALIVIFSSCENKKEEKIFKHDSTEKQQLRSSELIKEAWRLYESKTYLASAKKYSESFGGLGNKVSIYDRYNAACSWALTNEIDSSFVQLFRIAEEGNYTNYGHITTDADLSVIHSDIRWNKLLDKIKVNKEKEEENFDKTLVATLDTIYEDDQALRRQIEKIEKEFGKDSDKMKAHWAKISTQDSKSLIKVQQILDDRGWLGQDIIGRQGNSTLFLVIQHAPVEIQEKYLSMMRDAVKENRAEPSDLAILEDRVATRTGKRQIYGSQIGRNQDSGEYFVIPIEDPKNVDKRRADVGLGLLADYISDWDIIWDVEKHKTMTEIIESKNR